MDRFQKKGVKFVTLEQELQLSYYKDVAAIDSGHGVYLAQDVRTNKFYVKKLLTVYNPEIYRYLIDHPVANTPRIYLAEEADRVLTVIEEFIPGDTLEEILEQKKILPEAQVIDISLQLCEILKAFHSCTPAIVNRDIKPSNIKISPDGVVKLLDMNAAKWSNAESEKDTVLLGTQGYAAPEQYGFGPSSVLTDIYALGVLMNVMLTGTLPNQNMAGGRLGSVIRKCVELSPSGRYQSISEVCTALGGEKNVPSSEKHSGGWKRFLPPGFRSGNIITYLLASLGYFFLFWICFSLEVEDAGTAELFLNRIAFTAAFVAIVLFNGNYLDIHSKFWMTRSNRRWVRYTGMAIIDFAVLAAVIILLDLVVSVFGL